MIQASFRYPHSGAAAFSVKGHAGFADEGKDIVCAAVSSAAYMAANTVTEILGVNASAETEDGYMNFSFTGSEEAARIVRGLELHLRELQSQYPGCIKISTEV